MLGDNHSFLIKPDGGNINYSTIHCSRQATSKPAMPGNVGYVKVNEFSGTEAEGQAFSKEIQEQIKSQDNANIVGWIVDLRNNHGGNMWPILAGIGPVLGEGVSGYFIDSDGVETGWPWWSRM
jgi:carboxyl-terminal processing protease